MPVVNEKTVAEFLRTWRTTRARDLMIEDRSPIPVFIMGEAQVGDTIERTTVTAGQKQVTEVNSATIQSYTNMIRYPSADLPTFLDWTADAPRRQQIKRRIMIVPVSEVAGAIAATPIVAALADYTSCAEIHGIYAPVGTTDAANTWTISINGGTLVGPNVFTMNLTASRFHALSLGAAGDGRPLRFTGTNGTDDNKAMMIEAAALAAVGTDYWVLGEYWYE